MIEAENPSPRAHRRPRRERRRGPAAAPVADRPRRRITRRGWAALAAFVTAALLWGILIAGVAYIANHYYMAQSR